MLTDYLITVKTGDQLGAGTDSNVYLKIIGDDFESEEWQLKNSKHHRNKFERGRTDQFVFAQRKCCGKLRRISVRHDNSGICSSWYLEYVEVSDITLQTTFRFPCHRWIGSGLFHILPNWVTLTCTEETIGPTKIDQSI
uniref:PLAT domain-containing protein n=1 Tax=Trichuris muris TaxID=70415 RepID=A0A5S6QW16_TRIMR